jgi:hypothetical protein
VAGLTELSVRLGVEKDNARTAYPLHLAEREAYRKALAEAIGRLSAARMGLAAVCRRLEGEG